MNLSVKDVIYQLNAKIQRLEQRVTQYEQRIHTLEQEVTTLQQHAGLERREVTQLVEPTRTVAQSTRTVAPPPAPPHPSDPPRPKEPTSPAMERELIFKNLLDEKGKFRFNHLRHFAVSHGRAKLIALLRYPVLVGSGLFRGMVVDNPNTPSGEMGGTVMFQALVPNQDVLADKVKLAAMERSVYPLLKKGELRLLAGMETVISVGRGEENDIVMDDPSISHAQIEIRLSLDGDGRAEALFLRDLGSTNGVFLNSRQLAPFQVEEIKPGDEIKLGRFFFSLVEPGQLYEKLIQE